MDLDGLLRFRCPHDKGIHKAFRSDVYFSGSKEIFDFPLYLMAFTNRSGSNFIASHLVQTGFFAGFAESFNHDEVVRSSRAISSNSFVDHVGRLTRWLSRDGKMPGYKVSWDQLTMLLRWNIHRMFSGVRVIHVYREDLIAQAVSFSIARQTGAWSSWVQKTREPKFDYDDIASFVCSVAEANQRIKIITSALQMPYRQVCYENFVADPMLLIRETCSFAGFEFDAQSPCTSRFERQATEDNARFKERFVAETRARLLALPHNG